MQVVRCCLSVAYVPQEAGLHGLECMHTPMEPPWLCWGTVRQKQGAESMLDLLSAAVAVQAAATVAAAAATGETY